MKYGKCEDCKNVKFMSNVQWCIAHEKSINLYNTVICAFYLIKKN